MIVLKNFDFERKNKTNSYRSSEESSRWEKSTPRSNKKGPLRGVSKHKSNM
jgi:hypothetical protein